MSLSHSTTLAGDDAIVGQVVNKHAAHLRGRGFEFVGVTKEGSAKLQQFPVFHFLNKQTGMQIDISFSAATNGLNGGFVVLVTKPINRKLDVEEFLKRRGRQDLTKFFTYRDPTTDVGGFAESFLDMLNRVFDTELKPILDGKAFEETPIDWAGYK